MKTGILGGTFDPIHLGHLEAAEVARTSLRLDRVLLVPSRTPPHRSAEPRASAFHRFAMAALAASECDLLVSDLELQREGPSYTSLTLEALLREGFAPSDLFFITGSDAFADITTWHDYPRLFDLSNFAVVSRPGHPTSRLAMPPTGSRGSVFVVEARTPDVSSTDVRRRIAAGEPIDGLVPDSVAEHIRRHNLYAPVTVTQ
jgi:nicotinate-nucleotide adenylyltransferase